MTLWYYHHIYSSLNDFAVYEFVCDPLAKKKSNHKKTHVFSKAVYLCIDKGWLRKHATKFVVHSNEVRPLGTLQVYKQP